MKIARITTIAALVGLAGCAATPDPLEGDYTQTFFPKEADANVTGTPIRWGGTIVETLPERERTCVEILAHELDRRFRPRRSDEDHGRFLACRESFLDPEIFVNGREVTVVGELESFNTSKVGEFDYRYPVIDANSVYLWPERADRGYYGYPYYRGFYNPYFHHGFGHHGFGHHGFFGHGFHHGGFVHRAGIGSVRGSGSTDGGSASKN